MPKSGETGKIRIRDVAERAGVSMGTVDRVIHNRGEVSQNTREKVMQIIREMNYEPDILARTLVSKRTWRFGVLIPAMTAQTRFWEAPIRGMEKALREIAHFGVVMEPYYFDLFDKNTFIDKAYSLLRNRPDGLLLAPAFTLDSIRFVAKCHDMQIPVVLINSELKTKHPVTFIGQDSRQSGRLAAHLLQTRSRINEVFGIIHIAKEIEEQRHIAERENGFRDYFRVAAETKNTVLPPLQINTYNEDVVNSSLRDYLKKYPGTTSLFVSNSNVFRVAAWLRTEGLSHIRLAGYDLIDENKEALKKGWIDFLIGQKPAEQGYRGIMSLFNVLVLKKKVEAKQFLPIEVVMKENLTYYDN